MAIRYSKEALLITVLVFVVIASGLDLYTDLAHGASNSHIAKEAAIVVLSTLLVAWMIMEQRRQSAEIALLKQEMTQENHQHDSMSDYVQNIRKQLSDVITQQFDDWDLTASEREVGWLLLKGLSLKEISVIRDTMEKTVRQQASAIYKKAGLSGRHAFSAWFIEDLL